MVAKLAPKRSRSPSVPTTGTYPSSKESTFSMVRKGPMSKVTTGRVAFLLCLAGVAAILGYISYRLLTDSETKLAEEQFDSIALRALQTSQEIALRQREGIITVATIVEQAFPDPETWPFVNMNGFETVAKKVIQTSAGRAISLLPLVAPYQLQAFNDFANNVVMKGTTNISMYGRDENYQVYEETDGSTWWNSPYKIFAPFLYSSAGPVLFMANYHSLERAKSLDEIISCSETRAIEIRERAGEEDFVPMECSVLTDIIDLRVRTPIEIPGAAAFQPVYPPNNSSNLTGFVVSTVVWDEMLLNVFATEVSGIDCVLETETLAFTYGITNGTVYLKGEGDLHDTDFDDYAKPIDLIGPGLYSRNSATYTLTLYPSVEFFKVYATANPTVATVGSICIILFTSALFFLYDLCVRKSFRHKKELFQAKKQFVKFISHEVRTPLNAVVMGLQLLKEEAATLVEGAHASSILENDPTTVPSDDESDAKPTTATPPAPSWEDELKRKLADMEEVSGDVLGNAQTAVDVLNDLLNYDKVEAGTLHLELSIIPIWEQIEKVVAEFHQQAQFKGIHCNLDFSPLLPLGDAEQQAIAASATALPQEVKNRKVVGDKSRLSQVLRNLVSNALKFTNEGGTLTVRVGWKKKEGAEDFTSIALHSGETLSLLGSGTLQVDVTDTGAGMSEEQLKNLFREGVQFNVNALQAGQGSGLGLFIAKGILEQHKGSLIASSDGLGLGTTFTMSMPLYLVPDDEPENIKAPQIRSATRVSFSMESLHVLVVDDSSSTRRLLMRLLQKKGHVCTEAGDGAAAVQLVREALEKGGCFDVILMDNEMPKTNGPDSATRMRELGCDSFIVGVTGNLFAEDVAHFKECGANVVFPKPFNLNELEDALVEHAISAH